MLQFIFCSGQKGVSAVRMIITLFQMSEDVFLPFCFISSLKKCVFVWSNDRLVWMSNLHASLFVLATATCFMWLLTTINFWTWLRDTCSLVQNVRNLTKWSAILARLTGQCCIVVNTRKVRQRRSPRNVLVGQLNSSVLSLEQLWLISWPRGIRNQKYAKHSENKPSGELCYNNK